MKTIKVNNRIYYLTELNGIFFACFGSFWQYVQYNAQTNMYNPIYKQYAYRVDLVNDIDSIKNLYL